MGDEMQTVIMTAFLTVISGVIVYVLSECIKEFLIVPRKQYNDLVEKIAFSLIMYSREISSPLDYSSKNAQTKEYIISYDNYLAVSSSLRELSAELTSKSARLRFSKKSTKVKRKIAAKDLIGLSNDLFTNGNAHDAIKQNKEWVLEIRDCLNIVEERANNGA